MYTAPAPIGSVVAECGGQRIARGLISHNGESSSVETEPRTAHTRLGANVNKPKRRKTFRRPQPKILASETRLRDGSFDVEAFRDRLVQGVRNMRGAELADVFESQTLTS
jgi:hypothetical protein